MPFISVSDELTKKSFTSVENKFISKYLPVLEPNAVKVYLYALYIGQSGQTSLTLPDIARNLSFTEEETLGYFEYLEEFELVSIVSREPFEVKILEAENVYGTPKKFKPEKYSDFTKAAQNVLKGRMISPNEFREYFYLLEEYGFEHNALIMIMNYCVNLKGDNVRAAYIKKVAKSFADEGVTTVEKVDEKLSAYTSSTPSLIKIFNAAGIRKQPDIDDDKLYKIWTAEMGFEDSAVIAAAKLFKVKSSEKLNEVMEELYKNRKLDAKEISDYFNTKNSVYSLAYDIAKSLGVYMQNPAPYVENYVGPWCDYGYTHECLKTLAAYCFKDGKNTFNDMNAFILTLYAAGIVSDGSVDGYLKEKSDEDDLIRRILACCGLTRKIIAWDREALSRWKSWNFSETMLLEAAKISSGKSNPTAYMNGVLSSWKADGIFTTEKIGYSPSAGREKMKDYKTEIERHYSALRQAAENAAEKVLAQAMADKIYSGISAEINDMNIKLAFAEIRDKSRAEELEKRIAELKAEADKRLQELGIDKKSLTPQYKCRICGDTGYDRQGAPCSCLNEFLKTLK